MDFKTRPDCNLNLKNVKFKIGQKYHLMKLSYSKGFTNLAELYNIFDYRVLPAHHHYILIDTIGKDNKKCFTSIGLIKKIYDQQSNELLTGIQSPDIQVSVCSYLLNKDVGNYFEKKNNCLPHDKFWLNSVDKRVWGKKIGEGKLNKYNIKILNYFINNAKKEKHGFIAPLPFKFAYLSNFCNLMFKKDKKNYFNCHSFTKQFHENPKNLYDDIIKYSKDVNFDKIIDPETGKIHNVDSQIGKNIIKKYEDYVTKNKKRVSVKKLIKMAIAKSKSHSKKNKI
tara:strand:+ start:13972 stop:14817 length:846 start_codon:yes stop_codon:yes gene_type:complete